MKRVLVPLCVMLILAFTSIAFAQRCLTPADKQGIAVGRGVTPFDPADMVWCDDFDSYCEVNRLAESRWPGYPPTPDNICTGGPYTASTQWMINSVHWVRFLPGNRMEVTEDPGRWEGWEGNPGWVTDPYRVVYSGFSTSTQYHTFDISEAVAQKYPGSDSLNGTDENPLILQYWMYHSVDGAPPNSPLYVEMKLDDERAPTDYVVKDCMFDGYDCNCALLHPDAYCSTGVCQGPTCVDWQCMDIGAGPQCLGGPNHGMSCTSSTQCLKTCNTGGPEWPECESNADCRECVGGIKDGESCAANADCIGCVGGPVEGSFCTSDFECRYPCTPEEQAVCEDGPNEGQACTEDAECSGGPYLPIVVQQRLNAQIATAHPPLDEERVWASLAFGMLAQTDRNPCDLETGKKPTQYHAATFDGNRWTDLRTNIFGATNDFNYNWGQAYFELIIKSEEYIVRLITPKSYAERTQSVLNEATVPRQYLGAFNKVSMGTGPGCQVDPETGACLGDPGPWVYMQEDSGLGWHVAYIDRIVVVGGEPSSTVGACCLPNGSCQELIQSECEGLGGVYQGFGISCDDVACCAIPFADDDGDGDVDQADFGAFQKCFAGSFEPVPVQCSCFDRNDDGFIDQDDFTAFFNCWSGPAIPADPGCEGL